MATAVTTPAYLVSRSAPVVLWHLLSLDAPCVAALWTGFLASSFHLPLPRAAPVSLGVAVWLLYAADRVQDAHRGELAEERHRFHLQHRVAFGSAGFMAALFLAPLVSHLPHPLRQGWLLLAVPLCIYVAVVHLLQGKHLAKEPLVAVFFAAAITMPLLVAQTAVNAPLAVVAAAFGCLCWLNCIAIARWEETLFAADRCTAWLGNHFDFSVVATACLALPLLREQRTMGIAAAIVTASGCLLLLDRLKGRFARSALRSLADVALLTPLAVWPLLTLFRFS